MAEVGWVALWRKMRSHWLWKIKPFSPGQAWIDLILRVNFERTQIPNPGHVGPVWLDPGEAIISTRGLSKSWGWSPGKCRRFIESLKNEHMLETTNEHTFTRLKLLNWKKLQTSSSPPEPPPLPTNGPPMDTPSTHHRYTSKQTYKGNKEEEEDSDVSSPQIEGWDLWEPGGGEGEDVIGRLIRKAQKKTKMPNKESTLRRYLEAAVARVGEVWVDNWLEANRNKGKNVITLEDEIAAFCKKPKPLHEGDVQAKGPKCPQCKGIGQTPRNETRGNGEEIETWGQCSGCRGSGRLQDQGGSKE